jgi:ABC-type polysaccharide/polyol phosphate export permease
MAQTIQDIRNVVVTPETITIAEVFGTPFIRIVPIGITLAALAIGVWYFRREAPHFAENL